MVCTEYPPMKGASGPYVANLTRTLRRDGMEVYVVCNESGDGDFSGISPTVTSASSRRSGSRTTTRICISSYTKLW